MWAYVIGFAAAPLTALQVRQEAHVWGGVVATGGGMCLYAASLN